LPPTAAAGADPGGRVWSPEPDPQDGSDRWQAGRVRCGVIDAGASTGQPDWKRYQLRGIAIYDAWGREILCRWSSSGGLLLLSAGADGCVRWHPGQDSAYATVADATAPAGDDRDAQRDNIVVQGR
ncbi:MAG: hypothetical protein H0W72_16580, partial [Planctomycetes bacterium]|nr:hypothetical protein [Planctomycetota bacterium]